MVAISGGKDSYTMLHLLRVLQRRAPVNFELVAVNLDQGHPGLPGRRARGLAQRQRLHLPTAERRHLRVVLDKLKPGQTQCSSVRGCGAAFSTPLPVDMGCTKIALGHHRDDFIHTLPLEPVLRGHHRLRCRPSCAADDGRNVVIRPLAYAPEAEIARFAELMTFPIIPCDLCGSQENLAAQEGQAPGRRAVERHSAFAPEPALGNGQPSRSATSSTRSCGRHRARRPRQSGGLPRRCS